MGEDLIMDITQSIYFKTANELELMEIVADNVYIGIGYSFMWLILVAITGSNYFVEKFGVYCVTIWARIFCFFLFSVAANGLILVAIEFGHGDITREWCRTKAFSYFLMLHYHTSKRARLVLPKIECERQEALQRMEDERIKGMGKGEDCSNMQPLLS